MQKCALGLVVLCGCAAPSPSSQLSASSDNQNYVVPLAVNPAWLTEFSRFGNVYSLDSSPCDEGYSESPTAFHPRPCYNRFNPLFPNPSTTGRALADPGIHPFPVNASTNDARLFISSRVVNDVIVYSFQTFLPEQMPTLAGGVVQPTTSGPEDLPRDFFLNLEETRLDLMEHLPVNQRPHFDAFHRTICDTGTASVDGLTRNPRPCARERPAGEYEYGDCYDFTQVAFPFVTLQYSQEYELRSVDLTAFVVHPRTGDAVIRHVFPRNPPGARWTPQRTVDGSSTPREGETLPLIQVLPQTDFYGPGGVANEHTVAFFARQRRSGQMWVDENEDAEVGPDSELSSWFGRSYPAWSPYPNNGTHTMLEPFTSGDGMILLANLGGGLYYSRNEIGACRADGWRRWYPISLMPLDPQMQRYPLAQTPTDSNGQRRPFSGTRGEPITFGQPLRGAYPWMDRETRLLVWGHASQGRHGRPYLPERCRTNWGQWITCSQTTPQVTDQQFTQLTLDQENFAAVDNQPGRGESLLGAWTNWRVIHMDNALNWTSISSDGSQSHRFAMYSAPTFDQQRFRIRPKGATGLNSPENQLNYIDHMVPSAPFDVVWRIRGTHGFESEVAFDEYLRPDAFVVADMIPPIDSATGLLLDGFSARTEDSLDPPSNALSESHAWRQTPLLQNAAASSALTAPSYLRLRNGARTEPVWLGGVTARGVYLDGQNDFIDMNYPLSRRATDWYVGMWIDSRAPIASEDPSAVGLPHNVRTLFYFPDQTWVGLDTEAADRLTLVLHRGRSERRVPLPGVLPQQYFHLGLAIQSNSNEQRVVQVILNGTPLGQPIAFASFDEPSTPETEPSGTGLGARGDARLPVRRAWGFNLMVAPPSAPAGSGWFFVGDPGPDVNPGDRAMRRPFMGWIDELRIYSLDGPLDGTDREYFCNLARGTMSEAGCEQIPLPSENAARLDHPTPWSTDFAGLSCAPFVHRPGAGGSCQRSSLLNLPTLVAWDPRPDSETNAFCLTCHTHDHAVAGLGLDALSYSPGLDRALDRRRQPMDVPATLSGNLVSPYAEVLNQHRTPDGSAYLGDYYFDLH